MKLSHSNFVPFFAQNQVKSKKKKKKRSSLKFRPIFAQIYSNFQSPKPDAQLAKGGGGGACLNFAHFSMQFCNPGDPTGEGHGPMAPLNTPLAIRPCVFGKDTCRIFPIRAKQFTRSGGPARGKTCKQNPKKWSASEAYS